MTRFPDAKRIVEYKYSFSGHETFPFRFTWLPKGVRYLGEYPDLFKRDDAPLILGVGKNMVRSIRYWCNAMNIIEPADTGEYIPTLLGNALFSPNGWDPYLENPGTLWLLHWQLVSRWDRASTWFLAFTRWNADTFARDQLVNWLLGLIDSESTMTRSTYASMKRDVDTFIRTYIPSNPTRTRPIEDTFDCPLVELGLISQVDQRVYQFTKGLKPTLPNEVVLYAVLDFWEKHAGEQNSISLESLLYSSGSPGSGFKLSENSFAQRVEQFPGWSGLRYDDTAGMRLLFKAENSLPAFEILKQYYRN